jgi:hypothetical protein
MRGLCNEESVALASLALLMGIIAIWAQVLAAA